MFYDLCATSWLCMGHGLTALDFMSLGNRFENKAPFVYYKVATAAEVSLLIIVLETESSHLVV